MRSLGGAFACPTGRRVAFLAPRIDIKGWFLEKEEHNAD